MKHATEGWISLEAYYELQKVHEILPIVDQVLEGGYRAKAQLWGSPLKVEVLASGVEMPMGVALIGGALLLREVDLKNADGLEATYRAAIQPFVDQVNGYLALIDAQPDPALKAQLLEYLDRARAILANAQMQNADLMVQAGRFRMYAGLDLLAIAAPFGEIYLIWRGVVGASELFGVAGKIESGESPWQIFAENPLIRLWSLRF